MVILVLYGTAEGQTRKIAQFIADRLTGQGHATTLVEAAANGPNPNPTSFGAVVVAASLHGGRYQPAIVEWLSRNAEALEAIPSAFISVSLSAAGRDPDDVEGLQQCVSALQAQTGWTPSDVHHVAGAFRFTQYDFLKRWTLKYIAFRRGQPTDTSRDYELTDWNDLQAYVDKLSKDLSDQHSRKRVGAL